MNIAQAVQFIASGAWLVAIALVVVWVTRASRGQAVKGFSTGVVVMLLLAIALSTVGAGLVFIEPDQLAVVITAGQGGIRPQALTAGIHWVIPFVERVERYSILRQTYTMSAVESEGQTSGDDTIQVRTKDGQQVFIDASVIYAIDPNKAVDLYRTWRKDYENGLVRPQSRGVIRDVSSQFGVEEIVSSKRAEMEQKITEQLTARFAENNLILQDFVLRNIRFSDEYATAVEQKQIAEQQAQQAKFVVESKKQEAEQARQVAQGQADAAVTAAKGAAEARVIEAEAEAKARVLQAEAEAKALQLVAAVLKENPTLLQYQYISKLSPNVQIMLVPSNAPFILPQLQLATPQ
jgi:regulator of protease activity HflC (stomatin/prohibitin superfamily)